MKNIPIRANHVTWKDPLIYSVLASLDEGQSCNLVQLSTKETSLLMPGKLFPAGSKILLRVIATDGVYSAEAVSGPVVIEDSKY